MPKRYLLITGASHGLGRELAREAARHGLDTVLVALPGTGLEAVCRECIAAGTDSKCFEADLADRASLLGLIRRINADYRLCGMINNAGIGGSRRFLDVPLDYLGNIIKLNITATTALMHELLPNIIENGPGYVLNIASTAVCLATGYKTVYPASKIYLQHLTYGLREEFRRSGVTFSLAILGPMPTRPDIEERIERQGWLGRHLAMSPEKVARVCIKGMLKGRRTIVPGFINSLSVFLLHFVPGLMKARIMSTQVAKNEVGCKA